MFCAPRFFFGGARGVGSRFLILLAQTHFRPYRRRRLPFSCFALLDSFSAVQKAWGAVFMFCALGLIFGVTGGVAYRFHILRFRTHFRRYRGRRFSFQVLRARTRFRGYRGRKAPFSCFGRPNSFSAVPLASGPVFIFCAPKLIFCGTEGVPSCFHVFRSQTYFRRYRGCRVSFSYFAPNSFSVV
jgi:hypothetical protein